MKQSDNYSKCMTVVVPVYNRAHLITRCLDSIYAQTYRPIEVIVVDNASSDATSKVVEEWASASVTSDFSVRLLSESRRGAAYARQAGLDHTLTEKVMFFDSDDAMRPESVATVMEAWRRDPDADAVAWPVAIHYQDGPATTHSITGNLLERHLVHSLFRTQGYAVKTAFLRSCGGWKGEFPVWDDVETGVRLLLGNPRILPMRIPLADVYPQAESITGTDFSSKAGRWEDVLDSIDGYIEEAKRPEEIRLLNIVAYRRAILAAFYAKEGRRDLAHPLYSRALMDVPKAKRPLIRFAYHWTRLGMRGAFSIIGKFL